MDTKDLGVPDMPGRPAKISRNRTVSTKLTETEFADADRTAAARGQWLSEWVREVLVRALRFESEERIAEHAFTELVGLQLLLMNVLEPVVTGQKLSAEQYQEILKEIQATKRNQAHELLARRAFEEGKSHV